MPDLIPRPGRPVLPLGGPPVPPEPEYAPDVESGDPPSANAPVLAHLTCTETTCGNRGLQVTVHTDTVLPIHCGGCFGVLHCEHEHATEQVREGTIGAPIMRTTTKCRLCGAVASETRDELPPIDLAALPVAILDQPLTPGRVV